MKRWAAAVDRLGSWWCCCPGTGKPWTYSQWRAAAHTCCCQHDRPRYESTYTLTQHVVRAYIHCLTAMPSLLSQVFYKLLVGEPLV
jgi:hypothetical protein